MTDEEKLQLFKLQEKQRREEKEEEEKRRQPNPYEVLYVVLYLIDNCFTIREGDNRTYFQAIRSAESLIELLIKKNPRELKNLIGKFKDVAMPVPLTGPLYVVQYKDEETKARRKEQQDIIQSIREACE